MVEALRATPPTINEASAAAPSRMVPPSNCSNQIAAKAPTESCVNQRPVWVLGAHPVRICFARVGRQVIRQRDSRRRKAVVCRRKTRSVGADGILLFPLCGFYDFNSNRSRRTGVHARRFPSFSQTSVAHVALTHDTTLGVVLRNTIGTVPGAVLAPNACLRTVQHDPCFRIFPIGIHRTANQARRLQAVIAAHGQIEALRVWIPAASRLQFLLPAAN